jgi:HEAT repeat protein
MSLVRSVAALTAASAIVTGLDAAAGQVPPAAGDIGARITGLGSFDLSTRTEAARRLRRASADTVVPRLEQAVRSHSDEYVRFRALVILAGMTRDARSLIQDVMTDRNDRLRTVAYQWFEHHPEPGAVPALVAALDRERSEFVRPALMRALAAHGPDERVARVLVPLVTRGEDLFRGALIEALGDYRATYATTAIAGVAKLDGPLQDDAVTALGKIGDVSVRPVLAGLQKAAAAEVQPTISAAFCLLGIDCERQEAFLKDSLRFALTSAGDQPRLRGVVHALGMLATSGRPWALAALLDAGAEARDAAREPVALTVGLVALRRPDVLLDVLVERSDAADAYELLLEAFDMLSEDFEEERFYVQIRDAFWAAADRSPRRRVAEGVMATLEF